MSYRFLLAVAMGALAVGCSSSDSGSPAESPGTAPDPCSLLKGSDIDAVVERKVARSTADAKGNGKGCSWYDADDFSIYTASFTTSVMPSGTSLSGLGAPAVLRDGASVWAQVQGYTLFSQSSDPVQDGQVSAEVRAASGSVDATEQAMNEASFRLAKLMLDRL